MMSRQRMWVLAFIALVLLSVSVVSVLIFQSGLETIHQAIKKDFSSVSHISADQFSRLDSSEVVLFDVRELEEFSVSHIDGAIQLMPDIELDEFIEDYGGVLEGKQVVFYCSVGRRSSELASRFGNALFEQGATSSLNLKGGVFNWVNQGRDLSNLERKTTRKVHPYNDYWGRLVDDKSKISYTKN